MKKIRIAIVCTSALIWGTPAEAQRVLRDAWQDLKTGASDIAFTWSAPVRLHSRDLPALGGVLGVTGATMFYDANLQAWLDDHPESLPVKLVGWAREGKFMEGMGDIWLFIRFSGAAWVVGLLVDSETVRDAAVGCATAGMAQTFPRRVVLYSLVARTRPSYTRDAHDWDVPGSKEWSRRSFFGGHAGNAITCVTYWSTRYDLGWFEPLGYAVAIGVGFARTVDGAHWTSDTILGLAYSYAIARTFALRSKARARAESASGQPSPQPFLDYRDDKLYAGWQFRF